MIIRCSSACLTTAITSFRQCVNASKHKSPLFLIFRMQFVRKGVMFWHFSSHKKTHAILLPRNYNLYDSQNHNYVWCWYSSSRYWLASRQPIKVLHPFPRHDILAIIILGVLLSCHLSPLFLTIFFLPTFSNGYWIYKITKQNLVSFLPTCISYCCVCVCMKIFLSCCQPRSARFVALLIRPRSCQHDC